MIEFVQQNSSERSCFTDLFQLYEPTEALVGDYLVRSASVGWDGQHPIRSFAFA